MVFGQRLRALRIARGYTQKDLAGRIGVTEVTVGNWERSLKSPGLETLLALGEVLGVSLDSLAGLAPAAVAGTMVPLDRRESGLLEKYRQLDRYGKQAVDAVCEVERRRAVSCRDTGRVIDIQEIRDCRRRIAYFTSPSAAGVAAPLEGDDFEMLPVDDSVPDSADFAVRIQGDSMSPYIEDGETVFVDKDARLENGDVGIFCVDGAMYCKQLFKDAMGNVSLLSANPERINANIYLSAESGSTFRAYGKVIMGERVPLPDYFGHGDGEL